ncbi:alpha-mannosidase [Thermoanaerobacter sp. YS13]|uniref:alpha-mannosidase n=1 Tax=Thermoanaerobacter sp. YS13 TaxID=1511746 RepID=UPI0005736129|nr:alpha-mannosidase [Thermoanaerobacter sp. YS13]KHO62703.1 alpha-mannosidase [Thermoanaerobacter sp. YS13]
MSSEKKIHLIGNAHIDAAWLWRWQEGFAEIKATFRSALDRIKEFPDFIFTASSVAYYKWIEENDPEMFEEIKKRIEEGRWIVVGGWWVEPDCNIPSGESFIRQSLYGQRYLKNKFGIISKVGYNIDSFGHNAALPQILRKSYIDYYVFMRPNIIENDSIPELLFWWEGIDGTKIITYRIPDNYETFSEDFNDKIEKTMEVFNKESNVDVMLFYGVGNHGGGPTIENIKTIKYWQSKGYDDKLIMSSPNHYFEDIGKKNITLPVYKGELQHHASGTYSTVSHIKLINRKAEHRILVAEKFAAIASYLFNYNYPRDEIKRAWEEILFNHFHDIIGGCSIKEVYDDALEGYGKALNIAAKVLNNAIQKISWSIDTFKGQKRIRNKTKDWILWEVENEGVPVVIFNPLCWSVRMPIQLNRLVKSVTDSNGNFLTIQKVRAPYTNREDKWATLFLADIPPMGYKVYWAYLSMVPSEIKDEKGLLVDNYILENDFVRIEIESQTGYIKKLFDKNNKVNVFLDKGAIPIVIDISHCDTWAHGVFEFRNEIGKFADAGVKILEQGPLRGKLRVISRYNNSMLIQDFILYKDKPYIEVEVKLDWREKHKMLKLSFPINIVEPIATSEIPYGYIERPTNGKEEPTQQWVDLTGKCENVIYGVSIINNGKYSYDIKENEIRMTIANSSIYAEHFGGRDEFCEYMDQGIQEFKYIIYPHLCDWRNANVVKIAYELNVSPVFVIETYHEGRLPLEFSGISISSDNIIASVFKKSEDGDDFILRCYETNGIDTFVTITIPFLNRQFTSYFKKSEIKTFKIPLDGKKDVIECDFLEFDSENTL